MFNKRLLLSIILDKKKLKEKVEGSCTIQCIPTTKLLSDDEYEELVSCVNRACELLREAYIKSIKL